LKLAAEMAEHPKPDFGWALQTRAREEHLPTDIGEAMLIYAMASSDRLPLLTEQGQVAIAEIRGNEKLHKLVLGILTNTPGLEAGAAHLTEGDPNVKPAYRWFLNLKNTVANIRYFTGRLPEIESPMLQAIFNEVEAFTGSRLAKLIIGPAHYKQGTLKPEDEMQFSTYFSQARWNPFTPGVLRLGLTTIVTASLFLSGYIAAVPFAIGSAIGAKLLMDYNIKKAERIFYEPLRHMVHNDPTIQRALVALGALNALVPESMREIETQK